MLAAQCKVGDNDEAPTNVVEKDGVRLETAKSEAAALAGATAHVQGPVGDDGLRGSGASESEAPRAHAAIASGSEAKVSPTQGCLKSYAAKSLTGLYRCTKFNQDRAMEVPKVGGRDDRSLFGVFDGHGDNGHLVSELLMQSMPGLLLAQPHLDENPTGAFVDSFAATSEALIKSPIDCSYSGSTGVCVLLDRRKIICANVGDSRAVLAAVDAEGRYSVVALSDDHSPGRADEMKRIHEHGGRVAQYCPRGQWPSGPMRVWLPNDNVNALAMSRAFGDLVAASYGVTAIPEIVERDVRACDKFIIIASDGIWDRITPYDAVRMVVQAKTVEEACQRLCDEAKRRWNNQCESVDDITCVVIELDCGDQALAPVSSSSTSSSSSS